MGRNMKRRIQMPNWLRRWSPRNRGHNLQKLKLDLILKSFVCSIHLSHRGFYPFRLRDSITVFSCCVCNLILRSTPYLGLSLTLLCVLFRYSEWHYHTGVSSRDVRSCNWSIKMNEFRCFYFGFRSVVQNLSESRTSSTRMSVIRNGI